MLHIVPLLAMVQISNTILLHRLELILNGQVGPVGQQHVDQLFVFEPASNTVEQHLDALDHL